MRPLSKINWMVLAFISCSVLYFLNSSSNLEDPGDNSFDEKGEQVAENLLERMTNAYERQKKWSLEKELQNFKTEFGNLWRPVGNWSKSRIHTRDRVEELERWTKRLANSKYLKSAKPKKILVFDGIENYYGTEGRLKCPFLKPQELKRLEAKCLIQENKILAETNYHDVYVSVRNWKPVVFEQRIPLVQHVYYILESPFVSTYADFAINNAILTSYSTHSDIVLPYGYFKRFPNDTTKRRSKNATNYAQGKTKLAAIVVSNCAAKNDRLRYVSELQKYIPIDIYGDCGPLLCDNCFEMIRKKYKFYLAFEKANCRDYITEKFWENALGSDLVPVVLGAHPDDYLALAPPHSYIHVEDFSSPEELANYLILLNGNDDLYNEYFAYREIGEVTSNVWSQFFCRLCSILHYGDVVKAPPIWPEGSSWTSVNQCLPKNMWFWK